jgi:tRNA nucleotidyltransferase/poly(A) polymerase
MGQFKNNSLIDETVFFLLNTLEEYGFETRVVGGAVRDFLLHKKNYDVDIATAATPTEVMHICGERGLKVIPSGIKYGSVSVICNNKTYEITTLREDVKTFGRHAEVKFSKSFEEDSARRDFTINSLYMDKKGNICDYHSGVLDVYEKNVRFIGDPRKRIEEDYLRILRYFRFVASHGDFNCNKEYLDIINSLKTGMKILSGERIISELLKIFVVPDAYKIIPQMRQVLDVLFALTYDAVGVCAEWKIFDSLSREEKLAMLLKFSDKDIVHSYNLPKTIREMLLLKAVDDRSEVFVQLKRIKKEYRDFYVKFLAVHKYMCDGADDSIIYMRELLDFCQSEYVDFKLDTGDFAGLTQDELKNVMIAARKYWLTRNVSHAECKKFAQNIICSRIMT